MTWTVGDISLSETLTDNDHLYPIHINELRTSVDTLETSTSDLETTVDTLEDKSLNISVYNVKDYGAIGDGTTDDTTAIDNALTAIADSTSHSGILYFPSGIYRRTTVIAIVATTSHVNIIGDGMNLSQIKIDADVNGITVDNSSTSDKCFTMRDISLSTTQTSADKVALTLTGHDSQETSFVIERVNFKGSDLYPTTKYWNTGIKCINAFYTDIRSCWFQGVQSDRTLSKYGVLLTGTSTNVKLIGNNYYFLDCGIDNISGSGSEGITITNSHFVQVSSGCIWTANGNLLHFEGNHVEASEYGVNINTGGNTWGRFSSIANNFFLLTGSEATKIGIITDANYTTITGNSVLVEAAATGSRYGIVLADDADYCSVTGNILVNCANVGLWVQTSATGNSVVGNTGELNGTNFTDDGTGTLKSANFT